MDKAIVDPRTLEGFEALSDAEQISLLKEYSSSVKAEILKVTAQQQATENCAMISWWNSTARSQGRLRGSRLRSRDHH